MDADVGSRFEALEQRVQALEQRLQVEPRGVPAEDDVIALLQAGRAKIEAIKLYRERTGAQLAEAKAAVESLERQYGLG